MIEIQLENFTQLQKAFGHGMIDKSLGVAIGKTAGKAKTFASKEARKTYTISAGEIGSTYSLKSLSFSPPSKMMRWAGNRIQLSRYGARPRRVRGRTGVSVRVRKDRGRKVVKGAFLVNGIAAYVRTGRGRFPIEKRTGIAVPQMMGTDHVMEPTLDFIGKELPKQFETNLNFFLRRKAGLR